MTSSRASLMMAAAIVLVASLYLTSIPISDAKSTPTSKQSSKDTQNQNKTMCDKQTLDSCVTTLMVFGRRGVYLPKNHEEMKPHCQEEFDAEDCIKNYSRKCMPHFERQVTHMLVMGAGQVLRKRCAEEGTLEYLSHYRCIKANIDKLHDAMDQLIYSMMTISELKDGDAKIPQSCCSFARFQDYANRIIRLNCGSFDRSAEEYIGTKMIRGYVGEVLDLSCNGHDTSGAKCAKIKLPNGGFEWKNTSLVKIPKAQLPPNKPNSVVIPFLSIFTNL